MPGVSTQDLATWHHGTAADLEAPPSRLPRQPRGAGDVRIARVDALQRTAAGAAGAAGAASELLVQGALGAKIILRIRGRVIVVDEGEIEWIDGAGNYVRIHVGAAKHQVRGTLKEVEQVLAGAGERFVRVHRSTVVNIHSVREFLRTPYGDLIAVLRGGQRLAVGRVYRARIEALLETKL
jgi:DNA-binding LytR/AlgR family response regulator